MVLTIVMAQPIYIDSEGRPSCNYINLIDYVLSLERYRKIYLVTYVFQGRAACHLDFPAHIEIVPIRAYSKGDTPFWRLRLVVSTLSSLAKLGRAKCVEDADAIGLFGMNGINMIMSLILCFRGKRRFFFLLRGDRAATVKKSGRRGIAAGMKRVRMICYERLLRAYIQQGTLVFSQGSGLVDKYSEIGNSKVLALNAVVSGRMIREEKDVEDRLMNVVPRRLLFVGRMAAEKGLLFLVNTFEELLRDRPWLELHIAGSGPLEQQVSRLVRALGIERSVIMHGFVASGNDLIALYDRCDILVLPSYTEGLPRAAIEGMGRGLAVVATRVGGIPYLIKSGVNGVLIEPDRTNELVEAVSFLIENPKDLREMALKGYELSRTLTFETKGIEMRNILDEHFSFDQKRTEA